MKLYQKLKIQYNKQSNDRAYSLPRSSSSASKLNITTDKKSKFYISGVNLNMINKFDAETDRTNSKIFDKLKKEAEIIYSNSPQKARMLPDEGDEFTLNSLINFQYLKNFTVNIPKLSRPLNIMI